MRKIVPFLPLFLLIGALSYSFHIISISNIVFGLKQYLGSILVLATIILSVYSSKFGLVLLGFSLVLGTFNFVAFLPIIEAYSIGFRLNESFGVGIKIQPFSLLVLLIFIWINSKILLNFLSRRTNRESKG